MEQELRAWVKIPGLDPRETNALRAMTLGELDRLEERIRKARQAIEAQKQERANILLAAKFAPGTIVWTNYSFDNQLKRPRRQKVVLDLASVNPRIRQSVEACDSPAVAHIDVKSGSIGWDRISSLSLVP